ncbi:hypothetical protein [Thalassobellus citreus]|uniref:hypothetical protein n=1 Tax=Thalassobellus citreus TaxID=3367752 RepID=UPI0037889732
MKTYLTYGNRFCGVEHTTQKGEDIIYTTVLKKTKKELDIEQAFKATSIDDLVSKLQKKQAVCFIINNDHVLTKRIESKQTDRSKLVYNAFPNINLEDFFYEVFTQENIQFISICRKAYVETLIEKYNEQGLSIINISFGNTLVSSVFNYIQSKSILTSNARISIKNKHIISIEKADLEQDTNYDINGLQISNNHLLATSGALHTVLGNFYATSNFEELKQSLKNGYAQTRFFTQFLKFGLVFILACLLINFFVFNHYFEAVNELQQTSQVNQTTKKKLLELNESVTKSQKMVDDMLKGSASKSSFYVNAIIQSLPSTILLSELNYQPLLKPIKNEKPIEIDIKTILLSGETNHSEAFSKWIANLEAINWIQKVEILNYEDRSKLRSNFSLKLIIKDD